MAIKAVVFDIGGVLEHVDDDTWAQAWIERWEQRVGAPPGHVAEQLARHEPMSGVATGEITEDQLRRSYADALGLDDEQAAEMMAEMWNGYCGQLNRELRDFCAGLRPRYRTAILSNSVDGARREEQERYGFEQLVDVLVYSHEVGVAKPDPAIYRLTEQRLGVSAEQVLFIDNDEGHVRAAEACGWRGVVHVDTQTTIHQALTSLADERFR